jgi:hypothetical protein
MFFITASCMRNWRIIAPLVLLISACLLVLALLTYYSAGDHFARKTKKIWQGNLFAVVQGQGFTTNRALLIGPTANEDNALATLPVEPLSARDYDELRWHIEMPDLPVQVRFVWVTDGTPQFQRWAELPPSRRGRLPLSRVPGWEGTIVGIGLEVEGSLLKPLTLHTLELRSVVPNAPEVLERVWREWSNFDRWRGVSINTLSNGAGAGLFPPVLAVAAWIGLAALLWITLIPLTRRRLWSLVPLLLVGWVLLDIKWQGELWYNWAFAHQQYSGKSVAERQRTAVDGDLYDAMAWIKQALPSQPARLLLIDSGENDGNLYWQLRARYHLLPHNILLQHGLNGLQKRLKTFQSDDYLLTLGEIPGLSFADEKLRWADKQTFPAEKVLQGPSATLYKLR